MKKESLEMKNKVINKLMMSVSSSDFNLFFGKKTDWNSIESQITGSFSILFQLCFHKLKLLEITRASMFVSSSTPLSKIMFLKSKFDKAGCTSIVLSRSIESYVVDGSRLCSNLKQYFDNHFFIKDVIGSGFNFAIAS